MRQKKSTDNDYHLWILLQQVKDLIFKARENELSQYGFSTRQAMILFTVEAIGDTPNLTDIARWTLRAPHSISTIVDRMKKEGLVNKVKAPGNKGRIDVSLTEKGKQAYKQSLKRKSIREILSCLSQQEHQQLLTLLDKLRNSGLKYFSKINKPPYP